MNVRNIRNIRGVTVAVGLLIAVLLAPPRLRAQPAGTGTTPPAPAAAPAPTTTTTRASAIGHLVAELARGLGQVPTTAIVVASPVASDTPAPKGDDLAARIATHVAGRLGVARAHPQPAALAAARGLSGRAASLVYIQLEIAKGELRATADLYPVVSNAWDRLRYPAPGPKAHMFVTAPIDAEIRAFMTPILLEQATIHKAKHDEGEVLAVGCGDADGDGGMEIALVTRARISLGKLRAGRFVPQRSTPWAAVASRAAVPMREPIASIIVAPRAHPSEVFVGSTDRGSVVLDGSLTLRRTLSGLPVSGTDGEACAVPVPEASAFDGYALACAAPPNGESPVVLQTPTARFDAATSLDLTAKDGSVTQVIAAREPGGKLRIRRVEAHPAKPFDVAIDGVGAQIALADLDLDGTAEIIMSGDPADDAIIVSSIGKAALSPRLRLPAKEGVRALATCPPEERGLPAIVAVVGSEVWLVR